MKGARPRDPARRASADPTAGLPGTREGHELGPEGERAVAIEAERTPLSPRENTTHTPGAGSSGDGGLVPDVSHEQPVE